MNAPLKNKDYSYANLRHSDLHDRIFEQVDFSHADLTGANFDNCLCVDCDFSDARLVNASLQGTDFQWSRLCGADISGANLFFAMLEHADLTGIIHDAQTKFFDLYCPAEGAFIGYKKCFDHRIVQLLIPANARRTSATNSCCRCDKAKVLTIKDMYTNEAYEEAISYVDGDFIYRVGKWVVAENFNPNRWADSTGGIHFWLTRKEAEGYM